MLLQSKFTLALFMLYLVFYYCFTYAKDEERKWMVVAICEERETTKKIKKN